MRVGVAADHGGFEMKQPLTKLLQDEGCDIVDFGNKLLDSNDDYLHFAIPIARAVAAREVERGVFVCGSAM